MGTQVKENHQYSVNGEYIKTTDDLKPKLFKETFSPKDIIEIDKDESVIHGYKTRKVAGYDDLCNNVLKKGDSVVLDMGTPHVGYSIFKLSSVGSPPDAPLHIKFIFGEMPIEVCEPFNNYDGWISSSWLQEESLHLDVLPITIRLPRRYSFRYLKIEILDTSQKYGVRVDEVSCEAISSADMTNIAEITYDSNLMKDIDAVSIKTLKNCMQEVFEDGPKRDRRLWLGDLRLQALANYETFKNYDLVKRCLYLFAAVLNENGEVSANVFVKPSVIPDDTYLFDYSLVFVVTLFDYYQATNDLATVNELWDIAYKQVDLALDNLDEDNVIKDKPDEWWAFFDWHEDLNKQASSHAMLIYTLDKAYDLANAINHPSAANLIAQKDKLKVSAVEYFWDEEKQYFVSGAKNQVSWSSQIWMVLAGVFDKKQQKDVLLRIMKNADAIPMVTPYIHHYLIEALISVDEHEIASDVLKAYWGGMLACGADTFWELYDPKNESYSPYGSPLINSYCHAWSCTPTYFIRKYQLK